MFKKTDRNEIRVIRHERVRKKISARDGNQTPLQGKALETGRDRRKGEVRAGGNFNDSAANQIKGCR